jgi:hypothetical protein
MNLMLSTNGVEWLRRSAAVLLALSLLALGADLYAQDIGAPIHTCWRSIP